MGIRKITFANIVKAIQRIDGQLSMQAARAVNLSLTMRNWLIGMHIAEYELRGEDRSKYGDKIMTELAAVLTRKKIPSSDRRQLYRYLDFYRVYPGIIDTLSSSQRKLIPAKATIRKVGTVSPQLQVSVNKLVSNLSYSHFELLISLDNPLQRTFYEMECIRGNWSVRELKRQIASLYFERSGLSRNKKKLAKLAQADAEVKEPVLNIRDPYVFEFLKIKPSEVMSESKLEDSLLNKIQEFLLELGRGFCFEARQKRILIGGEHYFVDLVFYHRILKCHVLIELKVAQFTHEYLGQLNTYLNWYKANEMVEGDNPSIGILLCTQKNHALVEYALAGMENNLFVSRYQLELPKKEEFEKFLEAELKEEDLT